MSDAPGEDDPKTRPKIQRGSGVDEESTTRNRSLAPPESGAEDEEVATESSQHTERVAVPRKFLDAKKGRENVTVYISPETKQELRSLQHNAENEYPQEEVRKLDVYAAAVEVAVNNPEAVMDKLSEWGYGKEIE